MDEKNENEEVDMSKVVKKKQLEILSRLGSPAGINQNDMMALMSMMNGKEGSSMSDMMPMVMMSKMMQPKQDQMSPFFMMMLMDKMGKGGNSDIDQKIEKLENLIREKEEKKLYEEVLKEIRNIKDSQSQFGTKDIISIMTNKDQAVNEIKNIVNDKDRELMMTKFQSQISDLSKEIQRGSGGDLGKVKDTIGAIREIYGDLGLEKIGQKSKEETISNLIQNVTESLAPAINHYVTSMSAPQPQPVMPQYSQQRIAPQVSQAVPINQEAPRITKDEFGNVIYQDLIDINEKKPAKD